MSVEDYYWVQLGVHYDLSHGGVIDKVFADIENDIYGLNSSEQAMKIAIKVPIVKCPLQYKSAPTTEIPH